MSTPEAVRMGIELSQVAKSYGSVQAVRGIDLTHTRSPSTRCWTRRARRRSQDGGRTSSPEVKRSGCALRPRSSRTLIC